MSRLEHATRSLVGLARLSGSVHLGGACEGGAMRQYSSLPHEKQGKVMHPDLFNESILKAQYAVRGELYLAGEALRQAGKEIIFTNGELQPASLAYGAYHPAIAPRR